jgi:hypothetical protein
MKKELLIVILVVIAIIGISALLKYVIFGGYAGNSVDSAKGICYELCKQDKFSDGRCGLDHCNKEEKVFAGTDKVINRVQEKCGGRYEIKPLENVNWVCCCK